ncbi:MAG TPA: ABC transporter ATP-binding protein [Candidatus Limnocylindria bacterium]|nr:ABC transporter ATP-binding protein [Candidatus Limnocylindria bacterium]
MTHPPSPVPAVEAIGWGWRHPGRVAWAVRGLDLRIEAGERVLLLGPSGAGKSTILHGLAGLLDPAGGGEQEGTLRVGGQDPAAARDGTGLLLQDPESQLVMGRAGDDVAFGLENRCVPAGQIWGRVDAALAAVGFGYPRDHPTHALSGGEQQRLALAGTLALRPTLLLLDEPTANLDPDGAALVRDVLRRVLDRIEATLVMVEHRVDEVVDLVDRVVVVEAGGGVVADGAPWQVFARHGDELAAAGVWVPDRPIVAPPERGRPPGGTLVLADGATFTYPGAVRPALAPTDVQLRAGEALAITGPNGAGKSTLALLLGGLLRPTSGAVVAGEALAAGHGREPLWRWKARRLVAAVGSVFQDPEHQFLGRTVVEDLRIGPLRAGLGTAEAARRADELLERLHLGHLAAANPFTLSGGEQRRLSVATALAAAPSVLVLDEPTFGQDRRTWIELLDLLAALRDEGRAVCVVSHDEAFVRLLADRVTRLALVR